MKEFLILFSTLTIASPPTVSLLKIKSEPKIIDSDVDSKTYSVNTNSEPGKTDVGWNYFLNDSPTK